MEDITPKFTGEIKGVYSVRNYFGNTRPIPEVLYQEIQVKVRHDRNVSEI